MFRAHLRFLDVETPVHSFTSFRKNTSPQPEIMYHYLVISGTANPLSMGHPPLLVGPQFLEYLFSPRFVFGWFPCLNPEIFFLKMRTSISKCSNFRIIGPWSPPTLILGSSLPHRFVFGWFSCLKFWEKKYKQKWEPQKMYYFWKIFKLWRPLTTSPHSF